MLPAVIAGNIVGTVIANGSAAHFPIGAHVFSQALLELPHSGGLQEYTIVNSLYTAVVPASISDMQAALYPINAVTSAMALFSEAGLGLPFPGSSKSEGFDYAAQKLVILGGASSTGKMAIQFARLAGIGTIVTTASSSSAALLKSFGATHVIARQDLDIEDQVRRIVGDELIYAYETYSSDPNLGLSLLSNSQKGTLINNDTGKADEAVLSKKKGGVEYRQIKGFSAFIPEFGQMFWKEFPVWLGSGKIIPLTYKVIDGLDGARVNEALDKYKDGKGGDRYHVHMI